MSCDPVAAVLAGAPGGTPDWALGRAVCATVGVDPDPTPGQKLGVWVTLLLARELPELAREVAEWVARVPPQTWTGLVDGVTGSGAPPTLSVTAGRYVGLAYHPAHDLKTGTRIDRVPDDWLATTVFNLRTVYTACSARAQKWTEKPPESGPTRMPQPSA